MKSLYFFLQSQPNYIFFPALAPHPTLPNIVVVAGESQGCASILDTRTPKGIVRMIAMSTARIREIEWISDTETMAVGGGILLFSFFIPF